MIGQSAGRDTVSLVEKIVKRRVRGRCEVEEKGCSEEQSSEISQDLEKAGAFCVLETIGNILFENIT